MLIILLLEEMNESFDSKQDKLLQNVFNKGICCDRANNALKTAQYFVDSAKNARNAAQGALKAALKAAQDVHYCILLVVDSATTSSYLSAHKASQAAQDAIKAAQDAIKASQGALKAAQDAHGALKAAQDVHYCIQLVVDSSTSSFISARNAFVKHVLTQ